MILMSLALGMILMSLAWRQVVELVVDAQQVLVLTSYLGVGYLSTTRLMERPYTS